MTDDRQSAMDDQTAFANMARSAALLQQAYGAFQQGRTDEAEQGVRQALGLNPRNVDAGVLLGVVLMQDPARLEQALDAFNHVLEIQPAYAVAQFNRGNVLRELLRPEAALECFRSVMALQANAIEAHTNCGVVLMELGRYREALAAYDGALRLDPGSAKVHHMRAILLLLLGDLPAGWQEYEWRWRDSDFQSPRRFTEIPRWDGSDLAGKSILLHAEQGIGDEIMFSSCVQDVVPLAGSVLLECDTRIAPLLARSFPNVRVLGGRQREAPDWLASVHRPDWQLSTGSLPLFFRQSTDDFPGSPGFLRAEEGLRAKWRGRLARSGRPCRVGIAWRGGYFPIDRKNRTIALSRWSELLAQPDLAVVNLQYGPVHAELEAFARQAGVRVHCWEDFDAFTDLDDLAALIAELDLVISIDNATVHLAGALGAPTWVMLPLVPDWRWMTAGATTPWYPSLELFRQPLAGDWDSVLSTVTGRLRAWLAERRGRLPE